MRKLDTEKLRELLGEYVKGSIKSENAGFKICCPFHSDNNPSCIVFYGSGTFFCFVCHGDLKKGQRGCSAYKGFVALGMPEDKAKRLFLKGGLHDDLSFSRLPSFDSPQVSKPKVVTNKVIKRDPWPENWCFRDIDYSTISSPWFQKRFSPEKVVLKKERIPRFSMQVGGHESYKDTTHKNYLRHEVYLRLSTSVKVKAVNSSGLHFDLQGGGYLPATLFGLINNKLTKGCRGVILTEGPYDCIHAYQHIYRPEIGGKFDVIALLGTPQWPNVFEQLQTYIFPQMEKRKIPLILAFDNDKAGRKLTKTAIIDLKTKCYFTDDKVKVLNFPLSVKDIGDIPFEDFHNCLSSLGLIE